MTFQAVPWLELAILSCLAGLAGVLRSRAGMAWSVGACGLALVLTVGEWLCHHAGWATSGARPLPWLAVDGLSAPLLPLAALLHLLTALVTPKADGERVFHAKLLASLALTLATFGCKEPWPLIALLAAGVVVPGLMVRGRSARLFALHMALFVGLLAGGWACVEGGSPTLGAGLLLGAVLVRCGTVPFHSWVPALFEGGRFGTALLFVAPLAGVYAAVRLVLPTAPDWVLRGMGGLSLATALAASGLAVVQRESRRLFAYLFLSHASLVLVGMERETAVSLTGSLALWVSVGLSLGGLGLVLRAVEARFGRLGLDGYRGLYGHSPALAACFLLMGLASVGFPGTLGFIGAELLVDGVVTENPFIGLVVVVAGMLNGVAVLRWYFLLFTGARHETGVPLGITPRERLAVAVLSVLILGGGLFPGPGVTSRYEAAKAVLAARGERHP